MNANDYLITLLVVCFLLAVIIVITKSYIKYGLRYTWAKQKYKDSCGQIIIRNKSGNFTLSNIIFVDLSAQYHDHKKGQYYYTRDQFEKCHFFGLPTIFMNAEDTKTTIGLYNQESNKDGQLLTEVVEVTVENKPVLVQTNIPKLTAIKPSITLVPSIIRAVILEVALTKAIDDFLKKYQMLLIICGAAALAGVVAAYLSYAIGNTQALHTESMNQIIALCSKALNTTVQIVPK